MLFLLPMDFGPKSPQLASDASSGHGHRESPRAEGGWAGGAALGHGHSSVFPGLVPTGTRGAERWTAGPSVHVCVLSMPILPLPCPAATLQPSWSLVLG